MKSQIANGVWMSVAGTGVELFVPRFFGEVPIVLPTDGTAVCKIEEMEEEALPAGACPTISMAVDASAAKPTSYSGNPVATADYEGWLSHLEIYWWSDDAPTEFPDLSQLTNHRLR